MPLDGRRFVRRSDRSAPPFASVRLSPPIVDGPDVGAFAIDSSGVRVVLEANLALYGVALAGAGPAVRLDSAPRPASPGTFVLAAGAPHAAYRGSESFGVSEFFAAPLDASAPPAKVNGELVFGPVTGDVVDFALTSAGDHVVYLADGDTDETLELYSTRTSGRARVHKLNEPLPAGPSAFGGIGSFRIHPAGAEVLYLARQGGHDAPAPYAVPIDGGPPRLVGGPVAAGSFVGSLDLTPDGARIVFTANPDVFTLPGLFSAPFDGSAARIELSRVGGQPLFVNSFRIAPGSERVAFVTLDPGSNRTLRCVPIDHANDAVALSSAGQGIVTDHAFTPDGQRLVYRAERTGLHDLYAAPADGSQAPVLLSGPALAGTVTEFLLAPDSSRAVWIEELGLARQLWSAPIDGSQPAVPLGPSLSLPGSLYSPRVTGDSTHVVYLAGLLPELLLTAIDGSGSVVSLSGAGNQAVAFDLTPDGTTAVYWGDAPGLGRGVLRVPLGGGPSVRLSPEFEADAYGEVQLAPDGARVLYTVDANSSALAGPYVVPLDGSQPARLVARIPATGELSSSLDGPRFRVSADSSKLLYRAQLDEQANVDELFLSLLERAPLPGTSPGD